MFLGVWWNPFSWGSDILNGIISFFYGILLSLDCIIYSFVSYVYQIFLVLAQGSEIIDDKFIVEFVNRIYIIIGVVMLFLIAYSLLKSMVNPDEALKGKKSPVNIIKDVIISIALIALLPTIFDFAFSFQNSLLINNTIGKIILGSTGSGTSDPATVISEGGYTMAASVYKAFLHANPDYCETKAEECSGASDQETCDLTGVKYGVSESEEQCEILIVDENKRTTYADLWVQTRKDQTLWKLAELGPSIVDGKVNYYILIAPAAGIFVLFVLLRYCLDMALRLVKLAVYEVIAPIPIFARLMPGEQTQKVFSNWMKAVLSTFTEVFIRIAILYFAVLLISSVTASINNIFGTMFSGSARIDILLLAQALIIIGIIMFVKQAPEILKEITGVDGGKYGKSLMKGIGMMAATLGGGATAAIRAAATDKDHHGLAKGWNAFRAGLGGARRGLWHGNKVEKFGDMPKAAGTAASNTLAKRAKVQAAGGNLKYLKQWVVDKAKDVEGWASGSFEAQQKMLEEVNAFMNDAKAVKSTTEGFIRDKKYLFKYGTNDYVTSGGKRVDIYANTTFDEMEAIIQSLKNSGDKDDAIMAAALESKMNKQIKVHGQKLVEASIADKNTAQGAATISAFNANYMAAGKSLEKDARVASAKAKENYEMVKERLAKDSSLDAVTKFKANYGDLNYANVSDLADELEIQSGQIERKIKLEQERRKAKEKK